MGILIRRPLIIKKHLIIIALSDVKHCLVCMLIGAKKDIFTVGAIYSRQRK